MRRPAKSLAVDTVAAHELAYELDNSPPTSLYTVDDLKPAPRPYSIEIPPKPVAHSNEIPAQTLSPSIRLLFSLVTLRQRLTLLIPALIASMIAGGIAPFMTFVIGQVFDSFARFPLSPNPPQSAKDKLLHDVGLAALELVGLAVGSLALSSVTSSLWIWIGEHNVMALRKRVYNAVTRKNMTWFDTKMGAEGSVESAGDDQGPLGAGGLMTKFTRQVFYVCPPYASLTIIL